MFDDIRDEAIRKFRELKLWISNIDKMESYSTSTRGLFFVYIYGIYEEIIRQVVSMTINELNSANVKIDECIYELYSLIFSQEYDGLYNVGNDHKWEKRWEISDKMINNHAVHIPNEIMPTDGRNIKYRQLESIAKTFGMKESILPRNEIGGYIQEMVENRNYIAHGNKTPKEVGRNYTIEDIFRKCDYISEVCMYTISVYEKYISEKKYLRLLG